MAGLDVVFPDRLAAGLRVEAAAVLVAPVVRKLGQVLVHCFRFALHAATVWQTQGYATSGRQWKSRDLPRSSAKTPDISINRVV